MLTLRLAIRNLFRQGKRTLFTGLSMLVGFVLASFFIGWADGTYNHIIDGFTRNRLGHIQIHRQGYLDDPSLYKTIEKPEAVGAEIEAIGAVESWAPRIFAAGLASAGEQSAGTRVIGIDPEREDRTTGFAAKLTEGSYFGSSPNQAIIGLTLSTILDTGVGDELIIVSQAADGSIANDIYRIIALVDTGDPGLNRSAVYLGMADAQRLFVLEQRVHEIALTVGNLGQVNEATAEIRQLLDGRDLEVDPWQEFASEFYKAMQADKNGMYLSLLVVVIVVAITILNTVLMSVLERQKEYGVLRAIGTRPGRIVGMVVTETALLAAASIVLGSILGLLLNWYFSSHGIALANPIEWGSVQFQYMRGEINARSFYLPSLTVIVTSLLVCLPPALRAARTEPAVTMRTF
ncbi:MAG: ABC transporter permease [Spirochaetales bacterium]|nr:ABC transporter permease [Spirochaetales bacterium]